MAGGWRDRNLRFAIADCRFTRAVWFQVLVKIGQGPAGDLRHNSLRAAECGADGACASFPPILKRTGGTRVPLEAVQKIFCEVPCAGLTGAIQKVQSENRFFRSNVLKNHCTMIFGSGRLCEAATARDFRKPHPPNYAY
jgi:hypothetical protein